MNILLLYLSKFKVATFNFDSLISSSDAEGGDLEWFSIHTLPGQELICDISYFLNVL